jgi:hypothetical protein
MTFLTLDQFKCLGKKCSHCDQIAKWVSHPESPCYCDEHYPYREYARKNRQNVRYSNTTDKR